MDNLETPLPAAEAVAPIGDEFLAYLDFAVVGIGASAGGLAALTAFFDATEPASDMAYVVIQHLAPDRNSLLAEILGRHTTMPVVQIAEGISVEPNHVYVIRPGYTVQLQRGRFVLGEPVEKRGHRHPVDDFFRSLATEQHEKAFAVILSGMGTNGTAGAQAIKAAGGVCIAQDPVTAEFPSMPASLIHAGYADRRRSATWWCSRDRICCTIRPFPTSMSAPAATSSSTWSPKRSSASWGRCTSRCAKAAI